MPTKGRGKKSNPPTPASAQPGQDGSVDIRWFSANAFATSVLNLKEPELLSSAEVMKRGGGANAANAIAFSEAPQPDTPSQRGSSSSSSSGAVMPPPMSAPGNGQ
jgi:hypothetical protein